MEPSCRELIAPRPTVEAVRDRKYRWESSAVHIEHDVAANLCGAPRSQVAQEQRHAFMMARNANVFRAGQAWKFLVRSAAAGDAATLLLTVMRAPLLRRERDRSLSHRRLD